MPRETTPQRPESFEDTKILGDMHEDMRRLVDATQTVWDMRIEERERAESLQRTLTVVQTSYNKVCRDNEKLRAALQDITELPGMDSNTAVRLITEMALGKQV